MILLKCFHEILKFVHRHSSGFVRPSPLLIGFFAAYEAGKEFLTTPSMGAAERFLYGGNETAKVVTIGASGGEFSVDIKR